MIGLKEIYYFIYKYVKCPFS